MKMNFLFGNIFWGILLLLWGISLILKGLNIVDLPLVKIFIAVIIIMFGIRLLTGGLKGNKYTDYQRTDYKGTVVTSKGNEFTAVFSSQTLDLTGLDPNSHPLEMTAVFGNLTVLLPDDVEFKFEPTAVFGTTPIGRNTSSAGVAPLGVVEIEATAVFGKVEFIYRPAQRRPGFKASAPADSTQGESSDTQ